ncbi:MAG: AGE family epimerase/isomerase [Chloroflexota bacterium]
MDKLLTLAEELKHQASDEVMAFWMRHGMDTECGGYWTSLNRDGSRYGDGAKFIVVQGRTIYSLCVAYEWLGDREYLRQAEQGVAFFREHFRDRKNGGWYFSVSRDGQDVLDDSKQPYGLSFVSYGFGQYARLTGDKAVLQDAAETHALVMEKCWDKQKGGLPNRFTADWRLVEGIKRVDTHMHTMEGVSALYHATGDRQYVERLNQLANTILGCVGIDGCYDYAHGCTKERFHMDWSEALASTEGLTNLGHVTEAGWFIAKLAGYTGDERQWRLAKGLVDWAVRHGFDRERGGLHDYATPEGEVIRPEKVWWNQAELLGALAYLYRMTGEAHYLATLEQHWEFVNRYMADHQYGEWYPLLNADGSIAESRPGPGGRQLPADYKGSPWKAPYHVFQGLLHTHHDLLRAAGKLPVAAPKAWGDYCL